MKKTFFISILIFSFNSFAGKDIFCSLKHSDSVIAVAKKHSGYDKNLHCSVSCMLSLRCSTKEVLLVGYLKEFKDLLGHGTPDRKDIDADKFGIRLVINKRALEDEECLDQCDLKY
jgi:hypothetical protein